MNAKHPSRSAGLASLFLITSVWFTGCAGPRRDARVYFTNTTVNAEPARMILDTGSDQTRLFGSSAKRLGVKTAVPPPKGDGNDVISMSAVSEAVRISTGTETLTNELSLLNPPWFFQFGMTEVDGLVSWREVRDQVLVFDPEQRTVRAVERLPEGTTNWLKMRIRPRNQLWLEVAQPDGHPGEMLLDTGNSGGVTLPPDQWKAWRKAHPNAPVVTRLVGSIAGMGWTQEAWADEIRLGEHLTLTDIPVRAATRADMKLDPSDDAGTLGLYALARMDLVLDGKNGAAYLRPKAPPGPFYSKFKRPGIKPDTNAPATGQGDWTVADNVRLDAQSLRAEEAVGRAIAKLGRRDYQGAASDLSRALELDPNNIAYHLYRAAASMRQTNYSSAIADYTQVLELDPKSIGTLLLRGEMRLAVADFAGAIADCSGVIELGGPFKEIYRLRSGAEMGLGDYPAAIADLDRALKLDPKNASLLAERGEAKADEGDFDGGIADLTAGLKINPRVVRGWSARGAAKLGRDDFAGGIADLNRAVKLNPKNASVLAERGFAKCSHGDFAGAQADLDRAVTLDARDAYAKMLRGGSREICGAFTEALADYDAAIRTRPASSPHSRLHRELVRRRLGLPAEDFSTIVNTTMEGWFKTEGRFVAGQTGEAEFLATARTDSRRQQCEACYYAGMVRLLNGDQAGARMLWQKCLATEFRASREYCFARAELARLDSGAAK